MKHILNKSSLINLVLAFLTVFSTFSFSEPPNLSLIKNEVKNYHDSGLYEKELIQVINKAQKYIAHEVLLNQQEKHPQKLAIVLDVDETSLSNYNYMVRRDFTGTHAQFHQDHMAASTPKIGPMLSLYKNALKHGIDVFFVTGRSESERQATEKNLNKAGYNNWSGLYLRPGDYKSPSIIPFKSHARELISQKGYMIIATIGDQYSDIKGGYAKKGFKLPNPYYYLP